MIKRTFVLGLAIAAVMLAASPVVDAAKKMVAEKKYDEAIAKLEPEYKKKPTPELKQALIDTNMAKADDFMTNDSVPPRVKYTTALHGYRDVLKYDKDNAKAKKNIDMIESIYKQMGRPIPQ